VIQRRRRSAPRSRPSLEAEKCAPWPIDQRSDGSGCGRRNALFGVLPEMCGLQGLGGRDSRARTGDPPRSRRTRLRLAPRTEISNAETDPQKSALHLAETDLETIRKRESPHSRGPSRHLAGTIRFAKGEWWCAQSRANRSPLNISLLSGNLTGKFVVFRPWRHFYIVEAAVPQRFFTKFPKKINRVKLSDNRDRNRVNSEIQSGDQKPPFLIHYSRRRHARRRTACDRQDRQRDARSYQCPPGFKSSASGVKLEAVFADEIFLGGAQQSPLQ
jgi:hypothetical protein